MRKIGVSRQRFDVADRKIGVCGMAKAKAVAAQRARARRVMARRAKAGQRRFSVVVTDWDAFEFEFDGVRYRLSPEARRVVRGSWSAEAVRVSRAS